MRRGQECLADAFQKLHFTKRNAWYYAYSCTNDAKAMKEHVEKEGELENIFKSETPGLQNKKESKF